MHDAYGGVKERMLNETAGTNADKNKNKKMMYCYVIFYLFIMYQLFTGRRV